MKSIKCILSVSKGTKTSLLDVYAARRFASINIPVMTVSKQLEMMVRHEQVEFSLSSGKSICVNSVIQDTMPEGSNIGTVVTLHGSPGSHKDFKYITPFLHEKKIRVIGINFPGHGNSDDHEMLQFENVERNNYVKAVMGKIGINEKFIIMGHCRRNENATGVAAELSDTASGLVLVNPTGFRRRRTSYGPRSAYGPFWLVHCFIWLDNLGGLTQKVLHPFLLWFYNSQLGFRLDSGRQAMSFIRTVVNMELDKLKPKIEKINKAKNISVLIAYSAKDNLIELPMSSEAVDYYQPRSAIKCYASVGEGDDEVILDMKNLYNNGTKTVSVLFGEDGHFLQKYRPRFIAESVEAIFKRL